MSKTPRARPFGLAPRTFLFARDVVLAYPRGARSHEPSAMVWRQLVAAATSTGANIEEAQAASSRVDYRARVKLALREAREALYWLRLIREAALVTTPQGASLEAEAQELVSILTTIARKLEIPPPSVRK